MFRFLCFHSRFSRFLVPSRQRNHRKSCYCHGKYFAHPLGLRRNFIAGTKRAIPSGQYRHLACSGSQSEHRILLILPARGAYHIMISVLVCLLMRSNPSEDTNCITPRYMLIYTFCCSFRENTQSFALKVRQ